MSLLRLLLVACVGLLWMLAASRAEATTTCTATMTDLAFGQVNEQQVVPTTATIRYVCTTNASFSLADEASVHLCLRIGPGSAGNSVTQRYMRNPSGDPLNFRITHDITGTTNWDMDPYGGPEARLTYPLSGWGFNRQGRGEKQVTVYGQVPAQSALAAGSHASTFNDTQLVYRYRETALLGSEPNSCTSGGESGTPSSVPFTARATVPGSCTLRGATDLNFGSLMSTSTGLIEKSSTISLSCTRRTAWQIGLDNGKNWNGSSRRLKNGAAYLDYELYRSAGWDRWGNTLNADTRTGTGTGVTEQVTVHGRITNQPLTQAGRYGDTIKVTVTY